jgi:ribonuclease D
MELITSGIKLKERIEKLQENSSFVCLDTEFVREKTYYPTLGLIQIATKNDVFAIDPIDSNINLNPLYNLLQNSSITKVIHACSQDLEIFYNLFNVTPLNLFDTQIGAKMLGFGEAVSYGKLVESYLGIRIDKSHRYTDWTKRPLDIEQLDYAALDVIHLVSIFELMKSELERKARFDWACEESAKVLNEDLYKIDLDNCWKKMKVKSNDKTYLALIKSLCRWREVTAQNLNKPRSWILKDDAIQEIAAIKPKVPDDLRNLRFFRYDDKLAGDIIGVVDFGLTLEKPPKVKKDKKIPESANAVLALLKILLKAQSLKHDIAASVIADSEDLEEIACGNKNVKSMQGWRYDVFGKFAEKLYNGRLAITIDDGNILLIEPAYE